MKLILTILIIFTSSVYSQTSQDTTNIKNTALDYIEGWYTSDAPRMERALHPKLAKRKVTSATTVSSVSYSWMITATGNGQGYSPPGNRYIDIKILDISGDMATVKIVSNSFFDYVDMVNYNDQWKIVNVLWEYNNIGVEGSIADAEKVGLDYIKSIYLPEVNTISDISHPKIAIRKSISITEVDAVSLAWLNQTVDSGRWNIPGITESQYKITVLDRERKSASLKIETPDGIEHHHLTYQNGKWQIVNILWQRTSAVTGIEPDSENPTHPENFGLNQNYPNPFNPSTTITYSLSAPSSIKLQILSLNGEVITQLVDETKNVGEFSYVWDSKNSQGSDVCSGIYICRLLSDNYQISKKMLLMR